MQQFYDRIDDANDRAYTSSRYRVLKALRQAQTAVTRLLSAMATKNQMTLEAADATTEHGDMPRANLVTIYRMHPRPSVLILLLFVSGLIAASGACLYVDDPPPPPCPCDRDARNCDDFASQGAAQQCFESCLPVSGDIHRLDADNDGEACEQLR